MKENVKEFLSYITSGICLSIQQTARSLAYAFIVGYIPFLISNWMMGTFDLIDPTQFFPMFAYTMTLAFPMMIIIEDNLPIKLNFDTMHFEIYDKMDLRQIESWYRE